MPPIEEVGRSGPPPALWPEQWPSPWPDTPPATMPPAWYYPPPWWAALQAEVPPARHGQGKSPTYGGKTAAPGAPDQEDPRQHMVCLPAVLNVQQAADYLGVCDETLYTLVHRRDFPAFRIGRSWRIDGQKLGEWVRQQAGGEEVRG